MLRAENHIDLDAVRKWTQTWDESQYIEYFESQIADRQKRLKVRSSMEENIVKIKKICRDLGDELTFYSYLQLLNRIVFNCYFKRGNSALQIANFYEEIILPADQETRMKMFAYDAGKREVGELQIEIQDQQVGQLGEQSDMFHLVYDACFLTEDELFDEGQSVLTEKPNHPSFSVTSVDDDYLTLKIWNPEALDLPLHQFIDLFLYHCSTRLNLNFKRTLFDLPFEKKGKAMKLTLPLQPKPLDALPLLYFNAAAHHLPPRIRYLSFYHAVSHFFKRATHIVIREKMQNMFSTGNSQDPRQLKKMSRSINTLKETFSEKESLELVLRGALSFEKLGTWLEEDFRRKEWFAQPHERYRDLPPLIGVSEKEMLRALVERIYALKCSIEDLRDEHDNFIWLGSLDDELLRRELPLIRYLAAQVIEHWSVSALAEESDAIPEDGL
ncbi:hypothetical protein COW36_03970 [bacterium (Candidatus Blackallbacteria) CG17_big_fil_post_rev_8_21_14_2_50_48_46]|uniref:Uncharacterized protein n=1 Tax=bacterium (Candidatus Blackallbacteria) CG17_big_fil_post_rev_8_21_14_2_50_48_46 TaxID=2014261 RepID=A0A2M7G8L6_9BACT|nr:MAG: hypothetical protein COW64_04975 [bacterium (Candidatus Blackallbacteria) CG18_big_fil_WC_8_21_14_2_50_49_26]PIW18456.1 MAG: hypothetical protein COW36_03970 [bacterium (Candidatus Blackallbacteria) CG17_big_fil_post_rev_8_21_14_2_50_48_46]PIW46559.1 MAG: hypothetical protein COW20_16710 [bacterium (Candidatus Blackallbacteria) CG13_big_fil_rev_8_21_14_2_50_49_14]